LEQWFYSEYLTAETLLLNTKRQIVVTTGNKNIKFNVNNNYTKL
jgi:hypothetical protein